VKDLNADNLFNMFSLGDEEIYKENGVEDVLDNSFTLFGMVVRGVENYFIVDQLYKVRFAKDYDRVSESIKLKYFTGLIRYLERVDRLQSDTLSSLEDEFSPQAIKYALEEMLEFFEGIEYYENCALIKKYYDLFFCRELEIQD
jgi:hypothetical protein